MSSQKLINEFQYTLKYPFEYAYDGNMANAGYLIIKAPNNKVIQYTAVIEQAFSDAIMNVQKNFTQDLEEVKKKKDEKEESGDDSMGSLTMLMPQSKDYAKCFIALKEILCFEQGGKPNCLIDGITKMTKPLYDEMAVADTREVLGQYVQNFINTFQSS